MSEPKIGIHYQQAATCHPEGDDSSSSPQPKDRQERRSILLAIMRRLAIFGFGGYIVAIGNPAVLNIWRGAMGVDPAGTIPLKSVNAEGACGRQEIEKEIKRVEAATGVKLVCYSWNADGIWKNQYGLK